MKFHSGDEKFDALQKQLALLKSAPQQDAAAISEVERLLALMRDEQLKKSQQALQTRIFKYLMR